MNDLVPVAKAVMPTPSAELAEYLRGFTAQGGRYVGAPVLNGPAKAEASRLVRVVEASLVPAPVTLRSQWLARLGMLVNAKEQSDGDVRTKIAAYADMLDHPAWVFTAQMLKMAAAEFKWFPSFAEVKAFLDIRCAKERRFLAMLRKASEAEIAVTPEPRATPEQIEKIRRANELYTAAPIRKRLSLNFGKVPTAERARIRREITEREIVSRQEREKSS